MIKLTKKVWIPLLAMTLGMACLYQYIATHAAAPAPIKTVTQEPVKAAAPAPAKTAQASFVQAGIQPKVLKLGLRAYANARKEGLTKQPILTIVDYTKPSMARRLWVLDLRRNRVLFHDYVTHGKNSGGQYAKSFSNAVGSLKSSLGIFLTESTYYGQHGYSLRIKGLDKRFNTHVEERAVVFHQSNYATASYAKRYGQLGRSWGCFAVSPAIAHALISTIKNGSLVLAYYPDPSWLRSSKFLH